MNVRLLVATTIFAIVAVAGSPTTQNHSCIDHLYVTRFSADPPFEFYMSKDAGFTWTETHLPEACYSVYANGDNIYIASGCVEMTTAAIDISRDGGAIWKIIQIKHTGLYRELMQAITGRGNRILAGSYSLPFGHLWQSYDNGETWSKISTFPKSSYAVRILYMNDDCTYIAGYHDGLYISMDAGGIWNQLPLEDMIPLTIAGQDNIICIGGTNSTISMSQDGGYTWANLNLTSVLGRSSDQIASVAVSNGYVYGGTFWSGLAISNDAGKTWTVKTTADGLASNQISLVATSGNKIYVMTGNGMQYSSDHGQTWSTLPAAPFGLFGLYVQCV